MTGKAPQSGKPSSAGKDDLHRMQEDAVRRVQEMQSRARSHLEHTAAPAEPPHPENSEPASISDSTPTMDVFQTLFQDEERTLILALLLLLSGEGEHPELLFALLFLLL